MSSGAGQAAGLARGEAAGAEGAGAVFPRRIAANAARDHLRRMAVRREDELDAAWEATPVALREALQQAAMEDGQKGAGQWLAARQVADRARLLEQMDVDLQGMVEKLMPKGQYYFRIMGLYNCYFH